MHLLQILLFLLAIYAFDWTHIESTEDGQLYHVYLLSAHTETSEAEWLFNINSDCFSPVDEQDHITYPVDFCARVGTLSMAGFIVFNDLFLTLFRQASPSQ